MGLKNRCRGPLVTLWKKYWYIKCTIQICFKREAQAQKWDTPLDNKKVAKTFSASKVVSYMQCLDLHCISIRTETLKNKAAFKHTFNSELSNWRLNPLFKLFESLKVLVSGTIKATTFEDFLSSRSICLDFSNNFWDRVECSTSPCLANDFSIS